MQETPQDGQSDGGGETAEAKQAWWRRLSGGLKRSSTALTAISDLVTKRMLDEATLEDIHDALVKADLGVGTADRIADTLSKGRHDAAITPDEVKAVVAAEVEKALVQSAQPLVIDATQKPFVILVAGVNGSGKTTTIGKLAAKFRAEGRSVMLAAGDTFRAAAIEQLKIWATRSGADVIAREAGADAAGLAFDAVSEAKQRGIDILLIDTAGRLQNRTELMEELEKMVRVIKKVDPGAPHAVLLVLDATVGTERAVASGDFPESGGRHRACHDQARRHRARRHPGGDRGEIRLAGALRRRRRKHRRSGAVFGARFRPRHRRARGLIERAVDPN